MTTSMLCVNDLSYGYTKGRPVFQDLSFQLNSGTLCALMGGNGSGKSTLLHCLSGFLSNWEGGIRIKGKDIHDMSRSELARSLSFVPQDSGVVFPYDVESMVLMGRTPFVSMFSRPGTRDRGIARQALHELGIESLSAKLFNEISGGERQLVLIARALAQDTPMIFLDEPTNHLDFQNQIRILKILRSLVQKKGLLVLMATHDPNHVLQFADQVMILHQGSFLKHGAPQKVVTRDNIFHVYGVNVLEITLDNVIRGILPVEKSEQRTLLEVSLN
jgi:iron complex transport system ATP-binding protein